MEKHNLIELISYIATAVAGFIVGLMKRLKKK